MSLGDRGAGGGRVVVVGSANVDHVAVVARLPGEGETVAAARYLTAAGGKGLNQAVAAARQGAATSLVACVGDDASGHDLLELLAREGWTPRRSASWRGSRPAWR